MIAALRPTVRTRSDSAKPLDNRVIRGRHAAPLTRIRHHWHPCERVHVGSATSDGPNSAECVRRAQIATLHLRLRILRHHGLAA
jgi:hypothetical protein